MEQRLEDALMNGSLNQEPCDRKPNRLTSTKTLDRMGFRQVQDMPIERIKGAADGFLYNL